MDWESIGFIADEHSCIVVPTIECSLNDEQMAAMRETVDPTAFGWDTYLAALQFCQAVIG